MQRDSSSDVVIIGAGPYGLASAAHLRAKGVETRVFGEPMSFWERHMPRGMFLRSAPSASSLGDPTGRLGLSQFRSAHGLAAAKPVPIDHFVRYGHWFQEHAVPNVERRVITRVSPNSRGFHVRVADGEEFHARRVVVATGISNFAHRPTEFEKLPLALASHTFDQDDLGRFARKSVVVVGAGQSALESAALLQEAGASVEVLVRRPATFMIPDVKVSGVMKVLRKALSPIARPPFDIMGPRFVSWLIAWPRMYRHAPLSLQRFLTAKAVRPGGSGWLAPRLQAVQITTSCHITSAAATPDGSRVRLKLSNGTERVVDHVLLATGYRVDVHRYPFLAPALREGIRTRNGYPALEVGFESSVPGLHFLGTPAADTFGPLCRFVAGTPYMARALTRHITSLNGERADRSEPVLNDAIA
jgi:cation diffusion facilitator CzcD-associated flavoprotein CzcO